MIGRLDNPEGLATLCTHREVTGSVFLLVDVNLDCLPAPTPLSCRCPQLSRSGLQSDVSHVFPEGQFFISRCQPRLSSGPHPSVM